MLEFIVLCTLAILIGAMLLLAKIVLVLLMLPVHAGIGLLKLILWLVIGVPLVLAGVFLISAALPITILLLPLALLVMLVLFALALPFLLAGSFF